MTSNTYYSPKVYEYKRHFKEIDSEWTNYSFTYSNDDLKYLTYSELLIKPDEQPKCNLIRTSSNQDINQLRLDYSFKEIKHCINLHNSDCETIITDYVKSIYWINSNCHYPVSNHKIQQSREYLLYRQVVSENTIYKVIQPDNLHINESENIEFIDEYTDLIILPFKNTFVYPKRYDDEYQFLYKQLKTTFESVRSVANHATKQFDTYKKNFVYLYNIKKINNKIFFEITDPSGSAKYYETYLPIETIN
jgi:hypothetical protein